MTFAKPLPGMIINSDGEKTGILARMVTAIGRETRRCLEGHSRAASVLLLTDTISRHLDKGPEQRELSKDLPSEREEQQSTRKVAISRDIARAQYLSPLPTPDSIPDAANWGNLEVNDHPSWEFVSGLAQHDGTCSNRLSASKDQFSQVENPSLHDAMN